MKHLFKIRWLLVLSLICIFLTTACSDNDDSEVIEQEDTPQGTALIGGEEYDLTDGDLVFHFETTDAETNQKLYAYTLQFQTSSGEIIYFSVVSTSMDGISTGTYTFSDSCNPLSQDGFSALTYYDSGYTNSSGDIIYFNAGNNNTSTLKSINKIDSHKDVSFKDGELTIINTNGSYSVGYESDTEGVNISFEGNIDLGISTVEPTSYFKIGNTVYEVDTCNMIYQGDHFLDYNSVSGGVNAILKPYYINKLSFDINGLEYDGFTNNSIGNSEGMHLVLDSIVGVSILKLMYSDAYEVTELKGTSTIWENNQLISPHGKIKSYVENSESSDIDVDSSNIIIDTFGISYIENEYTIICGGTIDGEEFELNYTGGINKLNLVPNDIIIEGNSEIKINSATQTVNASDNVEIKFNYTTASSTKDITFTINPIDNNSLSGNYRFSNTDEPKIESITEMYLNNTNAPFDTNTDAYLRISEEDGKYIISAHAYFGSTITDFYYQGEM